MNRSYTSEAIEAWRDKAHHRTRRLAIRSKEAALRFIAKVGFCFAFKAEHSEFPCLWHATVGERDPVFPVHSHHDPHVSFVWEMKNVLPAEHRVYYGRLLKNRPTLVSLDFFPYFYALAQRSGDADEYLNEFVNGGLSPAARSIMDALADSSPQITKGLKLASGLHAKGDRRIFERAIAELQRKMFIMKVAEHDDPFTFEWETVQRHFRKETRAARSVSPDQARAKILHKYFENQLVGSVRSIQQLFGWEKQNIFRALGWLKTRGFIMPDVVVEGKNDNYYALV